VINPYNISLRRESFLNFINENIGGQLEGDLFFISSESTVPTVGLCSFYSDDLGLIFFFK
jgi:hypothetical protein